MWDILIKVTKTKSNAIADQVRNDVQIDTYFMYCSQEENYPKKRKSL